MPSTVYKGDIAEVTFAPETGLTIKHSDATITVQTHTGNTTLLRLSGGTTNNIQKANTLRFPVNMLVGIPNRPTNGRTIIAINSWIN